MGWAKYYEDNVEIMYERQAMMQSQIHETEIKVVCTGILPMTKIVVEIKEEFPVSRNIEYENLYIVCKDCGRRFLFTAEAQKHYSKMGWDAPKRCKSCRNYRNTRYLMCSSF